MNHESNLTLDEKAGSLFQSDHLLSIQFFENCRRKNSLEPERMLMLAVLEDAVVCIQKYASASKGRGKRWFRETMEWVLRDDDNWLFSFNNVCEAVDLDPGYVRRAMSQLAARESAKAVQTKCEKSPQTVRKQPGQRTVRAAA